MESQAGRKPSSIQRVGGWLTLIWRLAKSVSVFYGRVLVSAVPALILRELTVRPPPLPRSLGPIPSRPTAQPWWTPSGPGRWKPNRSHYSGGVGASCSGGTRLSPRQEVCLAGTLTATPGPHLAVVMITGSGSGADDASTTDPEQLHPENMRESGAQSRMEVFK